MKFTAVPVAPCLFSTEKSALISKFPTEHVWTIMSAVSLRGLSERKNDRRGNTTDGGVEQAAGVAGNAELSIATFTVITVRI